MIIEIKRDKKDEFNAINFIIVISFLGINVIVNILIKGIKNK